MKAPTTDAKDFKAFCILLTGFRGGTPFWHIVTLISSGPLPTHCRRTYLALMRILLCSSISTNLMSAGSQTFRKAFVGIQPIDVLHCD